MLKRSKKGFTLAELLIVVAIIAILVAIAVPLFVGSLTKAKEATKNANIRAARGTAVVYLLEHSDATDNGTNSSTLWPADLKGWKVVATVSANGEIKITTLEALTALPETADDATEKDGTWTVTLTLAQTEISLPAAGKP